jgi:hypothetical protein
MQHQKINNMKALAIIIFTVILIPVIFVVAVVVTEYELNSFNNYTELEESGLIHKGWVPKYIPESSYNIKERHRIDAPYIYVELNFLENDLESIKNNCSLIEKNIYKCKDNAEFLKIQIKDNNFAIIQSL